MRVRMTHPKLPGREIWVRPAGVKARQRAGWKVATEASKPEVKSEGGK